jgi:mono/diheme cytochrome c family protein
MKSHSQEAYWFNYYPVGHSGVPAIIFRLFPDVFPEIWGKDYPEKLGLAEDKWGDRPIFPLGLSWGKGSKALTSLPGVNKLRMMIVTVTCVACHGGRVKGPKGNTHLLVGAPNNTFDVLGYRATLVKTLEDPRWNFDVFKKALAKKSTGWLYKKKRFIPQELLDTKVFEKKGDLIMKAIKDKVIRETDRIYSYLGPLYRLKGRYSTEGDNAKYYKVNKGNLLLGGGPGQLEAFGIVTAKLAPWPGGRPDPSAYGPGQYFGKGPALVDIMSVWNQKDRTYSQWDGNIRGKLTRNLVAELGVIGDPNLVNFHNAKLTTGFVENLPSPPYLWDVDKKMADRGKKIFESTCLKCHGSGKFIPIAEIGTDENRAKGMPKKATQAFRNGVKAACKPHPDPMCNLPDNDLIYPRWKNPGYQAQILDGIWARSPYLHNGSVPTLYHLLIPSERPTKFLRGNLSYDTEKVGYKYSKKERKYGVAQHNTKDPGRSNVGHEDIDKFFGGIDFKKEVGKREDLIEYLKTL